MTELLHFAGIGLMIAGTAFLAMAALGVWRLPDLLSRLHVLTKADTAGVALIALGAACLAQSFAATLSLLLCTLLVALSGATTGHLIARDHVESASSQEESP
ncbi:cation:proton antiporter [Tropicimonas marinistellae]|uniref:cation:proton antiporter n=1 Tax=Tropicimonas marinistellae TaxID=1739787 RepID=UPI0008334486|nr:monovalent cation/H(+) antiporter subunit G [Tropicimonas marinistellae]